ncbi:hypothetical protein AB0H71_02515 [Nocardia sp. NPDC050697]|uniref:hypothetical protein n=1 Tax=Nocardia sp. NPDC050697 TaxID=3155158 RepID=UPI0033DCA157
MKFRRSALVAAMTATAVLAGVTTAHADDSPQAPVGYSTTITEGAVVTHLDDGTFAPAEDSRSILVRDAAGEPLETLPLSFSIDGQQLPLAQAISADGRTLTLTPQLSGLDRAALRPIASPLENQLAMNDLINAVSIGTSVGSLVGTAIGAIAGIAVGFAISGAACVALSLGCIVAVLPIMSLTAGVGGITGLIIGGGPTAAAAAFEYFSTLNAPVGGSKYAPQVQGKPGGVPAPAEVPQ